MVDVDGVGTILYAIGGADSSSPPNSTRRLGANTSGISPSNTGRSKTLNAPIELDPQYVRAFEAMCQGRFGAAANAFKTIHLSTSYQHTVHKHAKRLSRWCEWLAADPDRQEPLCDTGSNSERNYARPLPTWDTFEIENLLFREDQVQARTDRVKQFSESTPPLVAAATPTAGSRTASPPSVASSHSGCHTPDVPLRGGSPAPDGSAVVLGGGWRTPLVSAPNDSLLMSGGDPDTRLELTCVDVRTGRLRTFRVADDDDEHDGDLLEAVDVNDSNVVVGITAVDSESVGTSINTFRIESIGKLSHECLVPFVGLDVRRTNLSFLVSEMPVGCRPLSNMIDVFHVLPALALQRYARNILQGLVYLHAQNVFHSALSPHTVLVGLEGTCRLVGYGGLWHALDVPYRAPEVCEGRAPTAAADIWAFAMTLIALSSGTNSPMAIPDEIDGPVAFAALLRDGRLKLPELTAKQEARLASVVSPTRSAHFEALLSPCFALDPCQRPTAQALLAHPFFI